MTALVIDADPEAGPRYRAQLEPDGFRVLVAGTGEAGLEQARERAARSHPPGPDPPGHGWPRPVARLKADPATADIPIWVTTRSDLDDADRARINGQVHGIVVRGGSGFEALKSWLDRIGAARGVVS